MLRPQLSVGSEPLEHNQLSDAELDELAKLNPTLTYGNVSKPAPVEFVPAHVAFDKKVWQVSHGYFANGCQSVHRMLADYIDMQKKYANPLGVFARDIFRSCFSMHSSSKQCMSLQMSFTGSET